VLTRAYQRNLKAMTRVTVRTGQRAAKQVTKAVAEQRKPPPGPGDWIVGMALGPAGARRYHLYRPPITLKRGERLPLMVMLHGCNQTGRDFATSTRMNRIAARQRFMVLYPEQDRIANPQGCWNWYDTRTGQAHAEAATLMAMLDQVCLFYPVDRQRVALAGLSAGASMAALLAARFPSRFAAVAMHSGVPPGAARSSAGVLGAMYGRRAPELPAASRTRVALAATAGPAELPPLLVLHGDRDLVVSSRNAAAAAEVWADACGAKASAVRLQQRGQRHPMRVTEFKQRGRARATLCEVQGLGHAWSGGAAKLAFSDPKGPDASKLVWAFAARAFARVSSGHA
jgi:poly(hydroxyalkanoate) depolymerase family esterase